MNNNLLCYNCGRIYPPGDSPWKCECGMPLEFPDIEDISSPPDQNDFNEGIWAFDEFIPVNKHVSLSEGFTPEVYSEQWNVTFKLDYVMPSGSFKDRGMSTMISHAIELGVNDVVVDSSGNAGFSMAQYAARAGLSATVYSPNSIPERKQKAIEDVGGEVIRIEGSRKSVADACIEALEKNGMWYATHIYRPSFLSGTKTFAFEVAAKRDWKSPDAIVSPIAGGTLLLGIYFGFKDLVRAGWVEDMPRIYGAQAAGYAPIANALGNDADGDNTLVSHLADPPRKAQIIDAIKETHGDAVAIGKGRTQTVHSGLNQIGFHVEPTSALAPAALKYFFENDHLNHSEDIVVPLTGS
jgi:threonine synthase